MIWLFIVSYHPYCLWCSLSWKEYAKWGEWAWVGREYRTL